MRSGRWLGTVGWSALVALGCETTPTPSDASVSTADASPDAGGTSATVAVILGDSERGTADGVGDAARFQGITAMCALPGGRVVLSDTFGGTLRLLDLATREVSTLAGRADEPGVVDGSLEEARFSGPRGLGCAPDGSALLVADDGALRRVDLVDRTVTTVAGRSGSPGYEDGSAVRARLGYLIHAIVVTPDGRTALLADRSNDVIRAVDLESYEIRTVSGTSAGWQGPGGLAFDPESSSPTEVWVADTFADRIRSIDIGSGTVTEIASVPSPQGLVLYDGAILAMGFEPSIMRIEPGTGRTSVFFDDFGGSFASPIAIDGSLVYADLARGSIRQLALGTRTDTSIAGSERPRGHVDGSASEARFEFITDLATSVDGHVLFIADAGNGALRRARFAAGESAVVDTVTIEGLDTPAGLALTDDGDRLAISDYMTGRVYVLALDPMGEVVSETTIASGLEGPLGISWDLDGSLYVAEAEAARIARIAPDGTVSVHAGTGTAGTNDGPALEASFTAPSGVIASPDGLLITDEGAGALRFSDFASGEVVTLTSGSAPGEVHDGTLADATWGEPVRAVALEAGRWLVIDREAGVVRYVERGTPGVVRTVVGSPLRTGGLASGATVPLERAALGAASAIVRIEGGWLVSTETAVHRIEGDVLAAR